MKAMRVNVSAEGLSLLLGQTERPKPGKGQVLILVHAAGVTTTELLWYPTTHTKGGEPRVHAIPGHEFSGTVAEVGAGVSGVAIGQEVYGMNDWFEEGAIAEFCVTEPSSIAPKPASLTHIEAATVPIGALTAWQGLFDRAQLKQGERVLVHGGAGAVGVFAVQLAHLHGAHVIATASAKNASLVKGLGADEVIDHKTTRFEEAVRDIDIVFDTVGGETRERSWKVLKGNGKMVTIAGDGEAATSPRVKEAFFIVKPEQSQLIEVAKLLDAGRLRTFVKAVVPLGDAAAAYFGKLQPMRGYGKFVIAVISEEPSEEGV